MDFERTVVISCAGMGSRLGLGKTKALIEVCGKPLIIHHLEKLGDESDIRIVVGYQAQKVIEVVKQYRDDVSVFYNYDYATTKTGDSVVCALEQAREYTLMLDGDIIVEPNDMCRVLAQKGEFVCGDDSSSQDPWLEEIQEWEGVEKVTAFSQAQGRYEWNGVAQIKTLKILNRGGHVFQLLEPSLPLDFLKIRTREIDTQEDYIAAVDWVKSGYRK